MPEFEKESLDRIKRLLSRKELSHRWGVCPETIKRRGREGLLHPIRFNSRLIRYSLDEILRIEREAAAANGEPGIKPTLSPKSGEEPAPKKMPKSGKKMKPPLPPAPLEEGIQRFIASHFPKVGFQSPGGK